MPVTMPLQETQEDACLGRCSGPPPWPSPLPDTPTAPRPRELPWPRQVAQHSRPRQSRDKGGAGEGPGEEMGCWGRGWGPLKRDDDPLSALCPPPTHWRPSPSLSHSPCEYCAHCREEPLRGVEAEDGHAVGPLQAELQAKGRQAGSASHSHQAPLPNCRDPAAHLRDHPPRLPH